MSVHFPKTLIVLLFILLINVSARSQGTSNGDLKLWFNHPALHWNQALPVGNGRLGAMIFGGVSQERLQLNESSVWVGRPDDFVNPKARHSLDQVRKLLFSGKYAEAQALAQENLMGDKKVPSTYQTLGDLYLDFGAEHAHAENFYRDLDLTTAVSSVIYRIGNVSYRREIFSSAPDAVIVVRLTCSKAGALSFGLTLARPGDKANITVSANQISMAEHVGDGNGVKMVARVSVQAEGGEVVSGNNRLNVNKADAVTIILSAATDYRDDDPAGTSLKQLDNAIRKEYDALKAAHIKDYQSYFNRVSLDLGRTEARYFPTDARLEALKKGTDDPQLAALYFQFGRYLLISSSRPGGLLPANLQGIWADGLNPPWDADYHININIQMNYWPAEVTNLPEMHEPFLRYIHDLRADGAKTAKDMYGLPGTVAHFTSDAWHFTEPYGKTQWAMWPMGMNWIVRHCWEHYLFTGDKTFLKETGYPAMKDAAEFSAAWLVENPVTHKLVSGPSISPENTFRTRNGDVATMVMGPTMDHMIIRDVLSNTIEAAKVLGTDVALQKRLQQIANRLAPTQIGDDGRIMEWTEHFEEPEPGHRHISHLYGLHPGNEITRKGNPEMLNAARKTIEHRLSHGGGHTGWSRAWIINFFARLGDAEKSFEHFDALLQKSTLPNLFDSHPPFQIDGNFGAAAGIAEMLLQSHTGEVELLPALPGAWRSGSVHGLCARGGFEVTMTWKDGRLVSAAILSRLGATCTVRYGDKVITFDTEKNRQYTFDGVLQRIH
ncbi:MAG TPA: glycoside hydrolase family 95 protein [Ohtaekwangia sp.]|nr:glycoside hydrolase family 95 protein [Ohtaekwangia sp.]